MRIRPAVVSICMTILIDSAPAGAALGPPREADAATRVRKRLRPLFVAGFFLGISFWAPVEKLFLSHIGFTAATIGLLAATYAVVVPFLEIPSGILADRWSRRGVLMIADLALARERPRGRPQYQRPDVPGGCPPARVLFRPAIRDGRLHHL